MILTVRFSGTYLYESTESAPAVLSNLIETRQEGSRPMIDVLEMFVGPREWKPSDAWWPDHLLRAAVNVTSGYGALVWVPLGPRVNSDAISERVWVSDPSVPPIFDPEVPTGYQGNPFHSRLSSFTLSGVMAVLTNFCDAASGRRPEGVPWVPGEMDGERV